MIERVTWPWFRQDFLQGLSMTDVQTWRWGQIHGQHRPCAE